MPKSYRLFQSRKGLKPERAGQSAFRGGSCQERGWEASEGLSFVKFSLPTQLIEIYPTNSACPWLPEISGTLDHRLTQRHGADKGADFYLDALRYAQSQWISRKPAQAILQLNKAWMADLPGDHPALRENPPPYRALVWIMEKAASGDHGFMGNPVRHFQHLASRMSGSRSEIRAWRAWLCFHLAETVLDSARFPRDGEQIVREGLWIPGFQRAVTEISRGGWVGEGTWGIKAEHSARVGF